MKYSLRSGSGSKMYILVLGFMCTRVVHENEKMAGLEYILFEKLTNGMISTYDHSKSIVHA